MIARALQYGPYPHILEDLVNKLKYRPGWTFTLRIRNGIQRTHMGPQQEV